MIWLLPIIFSSFTSLSVPTMEKSQPISICGMVMGEASESDDEYQYEETETLKEEESFESKPENRSPAPDLPIKNTSTSQEQKTPTKKAKYNSLLHNKLRESNASLCHDLQNLARLPYLNASIRLQSADQYLQRSYSTLQSVPHHLKSLNLSLHSIQSRLETLNSFNPLF